MMALAAPAAQTLIQTPNFYRHKALNPQSLNAIIITTSKKEEEKKNLMLSSAYKRIPMEASGAYQLIDDATGEKFIVLGGTHGNDNGDDEISQETLDWNINNTGSSNNPKEPIVIGGSVPNFARLKAPKVKSLINKKKSSKTRSSSSITAQEAPKIESLIDKKKTEDEDEDEEVTAQEYGDVSVNPRVSATNLRGWSAASVNDYDRDVNSVTRFKLQRKKMGGDSGFFSRKSFKQLGCSDDMLEALKSLSFLRPSHIQAVAYTPVLQGKSCIIADQSGSGKTLAYLVPLIQLLRQEELQGVGKSSSRSPRVVILVPTAELASQVLLNCRSISKHGVPFRSMVATGGFRQKTQLDSLKQELDVLIATPGRFIYLLQEGFVKLNNLKSVVLDEVDILYGDEGFEHVLQSLINCAPMGAQYLFVTATLPVDIYNKLVQVFPDCEVTMGPGIHRTSSGLEEVLVDCSGDGMDKSPETAFLNKKSALLQLAEESPVLKTIIFCNKIETCRKVENVLNRFDRRGLQIKVLPFHAALAQDTRLTNMKEFLNSKAKDSMFLICTDRASRGIDFPNVDHVVLFDFPRDPSEYVRRVGRTARGAGGTGKAFVFVVGKQVSLARRIMERNKKGHPLHDVPSAYELESSVL